MGPHAEVERLKAFQMQPRIERAHGRPRVAQEDLEVVLQEIFLTQNNAAEAPPRNAPAFTKLRRSNKPEIFIVRTPCLIPNRIRSFIETPSGVRREHARLLVAN